MVKNKISARLASLLKQSVWNRRFAKYVVGSLVVIIVLGAIGASITVPKARRAYAAAQQARTDIMHVEQLVKDNEFDLAADQLRAAKVQLSIVNAELNSLRWMRSLPYVGRQWFAARQVTVAGLQMLNAGVDGMDFVHSALGPILGDPDVSLSTLTAEQKRSVLEKIVQSPPVLQGVASNLALAQLAVEQVSDRHLLGPLQEVVEPLKKELPRVVEAVERAEQLADVIPAIVGYPEQKTYLFLLQNNNELRPTGGFIGTYGVLTLKDAEVVRFYTDNIYNLDETVRGKGLNTKPWQLRYYSDPIRSEWFMRDGNWAADFPQASEDSLGLYRLQGGREQVQGVIATDPVAIAELIRLTGDITVRGLTFTPENLDDLLEQEVGFAFQYRGVSLEDRKNVIGDLGDILLERLLALPQERWAEALGVLGELLDQKHFLIYATDEKLQEKILAEPWSGSIAPVVGNDYFYLVDANMASKKTDQAIERSIEYKVTKEGDRYVATAAITYQHGGISPKQVNRITRYRSYSRLYVPAGSELIGIDGYHRESRTPDGRGPIDTQDEFGARVFGFFLHVEPGETMTVTVKYYLPESVSLAIADGVYTINVQKQPGTRAHGLTVDLDFGKNLTPALLRDQVTLSQAKRIVWSFDLNQDRKFSAQIE
jgi:hypothetical protein